MNSNNIANELNGCLLIYEIIGIQYFSLKTTFEENFKEKTPIFRKVCFCIYLVAFSVAAAFAVIKTSSEEQMSSRNVLSKIYQLVNSYCFFVFIFTSLIQSYSTTNTLKKFFKNFKDFADWSRKEFKIPMNFVSLRKTYWTSFLAITLPCSFAFGILVHSTTNSLKEAAFIFLLGTFLSGLVILNMSKFFFYICCINFQLEHLEKLLRSVFQPQTVQKIGKIYILKMRDKLESTEDDVMSRLLVVWKIYNKIRENASHVNKSTGLTVMFLLINTIMTFIYSGYELTIGAVGGHSETFGSTCSKLN